jgi:hypothetical protein
VEKLEALVISGMTNTRMKNLIGTAGNKSDRAIELSNEVGTDFLTGDIREQFKRPGRPQITYTGDRKFNIRAAVPPRIILRCALDSSS